MAHSFLLIFLGVLAFAQVIRGQATLGSAVAVTANVESTIQYGLIAGPELVITVDRDASVVLDIYANLQVSLPTGINSLGFSGSANVGYSFTVTPADAVVLSATLTTPSLSLAALGLITGTVEAGFLEFDSALSSYNAIEVQQQAISNRLVVPLPRPGIYVAVAIGADIALPSFYGEARSLVANVRKKISFLGEFLVDVEADASTTITVVRQDSNPETKEPEGKISMDAHWTIETSTQATVEATLSFTYDEAVALSKSIDEASIQFGFYSETSSEWEFPETGSSVDISAKVVSQITTHFSTWGVYADAPGEGSTAASISTSCLIAAAVLVSLVLL